MQKHVTYALTTFPSQDLAKREAILSRRSFPKDRPAGSAARHRESILPPSGIGEIRLTIPTEGVDEAASTRVVWRIPAA